MPFTPTHILAVLPLLALWVAYTVHRAPIRHTLPATTIHPAVRGAVWALLTAVCAGAVTSAFIAEDALLSWRLHHAATRTGAAAAIALLGYALLWHFAARRRPRRFTSAATP